MRPFLVYLSGPISGLRFGECTDWREYASRAFPPHIQGISPMRGKRFLENAGIIEGGYAEDPLSTSRGINTRDRFDTLRSDVILVNLLGQTGDNPSARVSIGTVMEVAWAYDHNIPVICAMEPEGNVHDHPMLNDSTSFRVYGLDEAIELAVTIISPHEKYAWTRINELKMLQQDNRLELQAPPRKASFPGCTLVPVV